MTEPQPGGSEASLTDEQFLAAFEACSLSHERFNHRAHIRVAYVYCARHEFDSAVERMRSGIQAFNRKANAPDALDQGYHETMTLAFMRLVYCANQQTGPHASSLEFCERHPELLDKRALRQHYSRERIMTWEAKAQFVEPDLRPLPSPSPGPRG